MAFLDSLPRSVASSPGELMAAFRLYRWRGWLVALAGAAATLVVMGVVAVIIPNPVFSRVIPVRPQDYVLWAFTGALVGLVVGSYAVARESRQEGKVLAGGVLSVLATGCPVCNKIVVVLLGTSGALAWFAPIQVYVGVLSLVLLGWTLRVRAGALVGACAVPRRPAAVVGAMAPRS